MLVQASPETVLWLRSTKAVIPIGSCMGTLTIPATVTPVLTVPLARKMFGLTCAVHKGSLRLRRERSVDFGQQPCVKIGLQLGL